MGNRQPLTSRPQPRSDVEHRVESPAKRQDALIFEHWTELVRPLVLLVNGLDCATRTAVSLMFRTEVFRF